MGHYHCEPFRALRVQVHSPYVRPSVNFNHRPTKILITGGSGCGKTTKYYDLIGREKAKYRFVFDSDGEFCSRNKYPPARTRDDIVRATGQGTCVFYPGDLYPGRLLDGFKFFCDFVYTVSCELKGRKIFAMDEIKRVMGTNFCPHEFTVLLENGRKSECDLILICQSPNQAHTSIRNQLTQAYTFRHIDKRAMEWLEEQDIPGNDMRALKRGEYLHKNFETGDLTKGGKAFK